MGLKRSERPLQVLFRFLKTCWFLHRTMGLLRKLAILALIGAILVGVVIVKFPVPDDMEEKCMARFVSATGAALEVTSRALEKLKVGTQAELLQAMTEYALRGFSLFSMPGIKESWETIAGHPVMMFEPESRVKDGPVIIYIHGGGWTWFSPKSYRRVTQKLAKETNYLVMSIDYPLAPKHVHPAQKNACVAVVKHVLANAKKFGVDKNKVIVAGDSAGGHLTAAVSLALQSDNPNASHPLAAQVLIYPALQSVDFSLPSYQNDTKVELTAEDMAFMYQIHATGTADPAGIMAVLDGKHISAKHQKLVRSKINHKRLPTSNFHQDYKTKDFNKAETQYKDFEKASLDPFFSPLLANSYKGLPPTLVLTMQYDVLRDDGYLYVDRLKSDKVKVSHKNYNSFHGAISYPVKIPFFQDIAEFTKSVVERKK